MADLITTIQDAIVTKLAELDADQEGGYLRRRAAFNGTGLADIIRQLELRTPAVVVSFKDVDVASGMFVRGDDLTLRFSLWCASSNLRGQESGAQGSGVAGEEPGAFQLTEDAIKCLRQFRATYGGRQTLGVVFSAAEWLPSDGGIAVVRLDCAATIPQHDWE
ncbi:phage protein Gp37 [Candidatus Sumerlaeota bacterium]